MQLPANHETPTPGAAQAGQYVDLWMSAFKLRSQSSLPAGPSTSATPTATMAKVAATEVDQRLKTINPEQYAEQLHGVQETMLNRMAGGKYTSVQQMLNEPYQFSKITGPTKLHPYGSVANTPTPDAALMGDWQRALQDRERLAGRRAQLPQPGLRRPKQPQFLGQLGCGAGRGRSITAPLPANFPSRPSASTLARGRERIAGAS